MLNIPDNWMTPTNPSVLQSNTPTPQSQYSMWMGNPMGNIPTNQNCAMPYLRSPNPYSFNSSNTSISCVPNVTVSNPAVSSSFDSSKFESCDISSFPPNRDVLRTSAWSPLTPPPIWVLILPLSLLCDTLCTYKCATTIKSSLFYSSSLHRERHIEYLDARNGGMAVESKVKRDLKQRNLEVWKRTFSIVLSGNKFVLLVYTLENKLFLSIPLVTFFHLLVHSVRRYQTFYIDLQPLPLSKRTRSIVRLIKTL